MEWRFVLLFFGKEDMTTFERYFIKDKTTHKENMKLHYDFRDTEENVQFNLSRIWFKSIRIRIINGHAPVKNKFGENPVR